MSSVVDCKECNGMPLSPQFATKEGQMAMTCILLVASLEQLQAENAKLRKFISLKETCWKYVGWCDECPYNGVDDEHDDCNCTVQERISSLARELGIEAEECTTRQ